MISRVSEEAVELIVEGANAGTSSDLGASGPTAHSWEISCAGRDAFRTSPHAMLVEGRCAIVYDLLQCLSNFADAGQSGPKIAFTKAPAGEGGTGTHGRDAGEYHRPVGSGPCRDVL
jgi:hypothetical protein